MRSREEFLTALHEMWEQGGDDRPQKENTMYREWYQEMAVGDHAHVRLWTDVYPATIIRRTKCSITVRYDKATLDPSWKPEWVPGGFSAICTNNDDQKWVIEEDPNGDVETFRWHTRDNCWMHDGCRLLPGWQKVYDYNF